MIKIPPGWSFPLNTFCFQCLPAGLSRLNILNVAIRWWLSLEEDSIIPVCHIVTPNHSHCLIYHLRFPHGCRLCIDLLGNGNSNEFCQQEWQGKYAAHYHRLCHLLVFLSDPGKSLLTHFILLLAPRGIWVCSPIKLSIKTTPAYSPSSKWLIMPYSK